MHPSTPVRSSAIADKHPPFIIPRAELAACRNGRTEFVGVALRQTDDPCYFCAMGERDRARLEGNVA